MRWSGVLLCFAVSLMALLVGFAALVWHVDRDLPDPRMVLAGQPAVSAGPDGRGPIAAPHGPVPLASVPPHAIQAFVAAEDKTFFEHSGVSLWALARAAMLGLASRRERPPASSTITMQVARRLLGDGERNARRKLREVLLAWRLDGTLSKERILEIYLNRIYFGSGAYGIGAAAETYFRKPVADLTLAEAAYLAALPKRPAQLGRPEHADEARGRRDWVIGRMVEERFITIAQAIGARAEPLPSAMLR